MKKYRLSALVLSLILSVSLLPMGVPAQEAGQGMTGETAAASSKRTSCKVTLPENQEGVLVRTLESPETEPGGSFTFYVALAEGWEKTADFAVKAGGSILKPVPVRQEDGKKDDSGQEGQAQESNSDTEAGDGSPSASPEDSGTPGPAEAREKALLAQGYEKYVISEVRENMTVTIAGVEKKPSEDLAGQAPEDPGLSAAGQDQSPEETAPEADQAGPADQSQPYEDGDLSPEFSLDEPVQDEETSPDMVIVSDPEEPQDNAAYTGDAAFVEEESGTEDAAFVEEESGTEDAAFVGDESGTDDTVTPEEESDREDAASAADEFGMVDGHLSDKGDSREGDDASGEGDTSDEEYSDDEEVPPEETYPLWVGGVQATSDNDLDILEDGCVIYDRGENILTLEDAVISGRGKTKAPVYYKGSEPLTIHVSGDCSIRSGDHVSGILSEKASLIFDGSGTLTVKTAALAPDACIQADQGDITIRGGSVKAVSSDSGAGLGAKNISVQNEAVLVRAISRKEAITARGGISIGDRLGIVIPANGSLSPDKKTIQDEKGKAADSVRIEARPVCRVSFTPGDGSGSMDAIEVVSGKEVTLPACAFDAPQCRAFYKWRIHNKNYASGDKVRVTKNLTVTAQWKTSHTLSRVDAKEPLCEKDGNIEYYVCSVCHKSFRDSDAKKTIKESDTILKAIGHKWGTPSYKWTSDYASVTAERVCQNDQTHKQTRTVKTTKTGKGPTCLKEGTFTYTADFKEAGFIKQIKNVKKPALGHLWGKPKFEWFEEEDGSRLATCVFTCTRDESHEKHVDVDIKKAVTMPNKTANGKLISTATAKFGGRTFTDTREEIIAPAGSTGYRFREAEDSWTRGSGKSLHYRVKRSKYDLITYREFSHITVDGKTVGSGSYSTSEGSLKLKIGKDFLETLSVGRHTLVVEFKDGSASRQFTVKDAGAASGSSAPSTGDQSGILMWALSFAACAAAIGGLVLARRRSRHS